MIGLRLQLQEGEGVADYERMGRPCLGALETNLAKKHESRPPRLPEACSLPSIGLALLS